jgi:hypothetical protein
LLAGPQSRPIEYAELDQIRERGGGITPPGALARVEHALFVLILASVGYLWVAQAIGLS